MKRVGWLLVLLLTLALGSTVSAHSMAVIAKVDFAPTAGGPIRVELTDPYENLIPTAKGQAALVPKGEEPKKWVDMKEDPEGVHTAVLPKAGQASVLYLSFVWPDDQWAVEIPVQSGKAINGETFMLRQIAVNMAAPAQQSAWPWWVYPAYGAALLLIGWGFWQTFWRKGPEQ